ncbi:unnamed protein product [Phytomonas sp. Hart1]|nr:unnamed protein product [Phytomonas sp. Hart1]|eukprot:CCW69950.1 unnamed protein product [Phytomonas sp. isolate Hart1]
MDLMDGTLGRFLSDADAGFDPLYDTLVNSPLADGELFQFLYAQLVLKAVFDWKVLDVMLNGQLRGDNIGVRSLASPGLDGPPGGGPFRGILIAFEAFPRAGRRYLRFPADLAADSCGAARTMRFIHFLDLAQGFQPEINHLVAKGLLGECVLLSSCMEDDILGRYWPPHELYCRDLGVCGALGEKVVDWGRHLRIHSKADAREALQQLFELYYPQYGIENPTEEVRQTHAVYEWNPEVVETLSTSYVFLPNNSDSPHSPCEMDEWSA